MIIVIGDFILNDGRVLLVIGSSSFSFYVGEECIDYFDKISLHGIIFWVLNDCYTFLFGVPDGRLCRLPDGRRAMSRVWIRDF